jgi:hypothetical protein
MEKPGLSPLSGTVLHWRNAESKERFAFIAKAAADTGG